MPSASRAVMVSGTAALAALGQHLRLALCDATVVGGEFGGRPILALADVPAVFQQALLPAPHVQHKPRYRRVGHRGERRTDAAVDRVNAAVEVDVDLPVERGDQIG